MFKFRLFRKKKANFKVDYYSQSSVEEDTSRHTETKKHPLKKIDRQFNILGLHKHGRNLFSRCFKGASKCLVFSSKPNEPNETYLSEGNLEIKSSIDGNRENASTKFSPNCLKSDSSRKCLAEKLFDLSKHGWYWGPLSQSEANEKLGGESDGAFLVRDSSCDQHVLTLSFRSHQQTFHTHIYHIGATFSLDSSVYFDTMEELITHSMNHFLVARRNPNDRYNVIYVKLTQPVSRFTQVRPLQYLCRFVIRQYVRADMRQKLPLPQPLMEFIEEGQF